MRREDLPKGPSATFVVPDWRVAYVSVPKVACTSLKWLMADLAGEDPEQFRSTISSETTRDATIHHRSRWRHTPSLKQLPPEQLAEVGPDQGWFVFGAVRHPTVRLWSGWQSKYLLAEPHFKRVDHEAPWPRLPRSTEHVVEDFHEFVHHLRAHPDSATARDKHFRAQHRLLRPDTVDYTRIYRTDELGELLDDLSTHLRDQGREEMPQFRTHNEAPLQPIPALFSPEVLDIATELFAEDYAAFGFDDPMPPRLTASGYSGPELAEVVRLAERAQRYGDMYDVLDRLRQERRATRDKLSAARAEHRATLRQVRQRHRATTDELRESRAALQRDHDRLLERLAARPTVRVRRLAGRIRARLSGRRRGSAPDQP